MPEEATKIDVEALKKGGYTGGGMPGYESMMGLGSGGKAPVAKQEVPKKYSDENSSQIDAVVTEEGPNEFTFNLEK